MLAATVELAGLSVVDVGCGDGHFTRFMASEGADVIGVECSPEQLERARKQPRIGNERYINGVGENLPVAPEQCDLVTFFNSLHHVPVGSQMKALIDARRALRQDGMVYVAEPVAEGPAFEFLLPLEDETDVRAAAYQAIKDSISTGLAALQEIFYLCAVNYPDFETFEDAAIRVSPARADKMQAIRHDMYDRFHQLGIEELDGSYSFNQPMRVNLFQAL